MAIQYIILQKTLHSKTPIGSSKVDHINHQDTPNYHNLDAGATDVIQKNVTDHKLLYMEAEFNDDPVFIMGKRPRWKYNNFNDEQRVFTFQNNLKINEFKSLSLLY